MLGITGAVTKGVPLRVLHLLPGLVTILLTLPKWKRGFSNEDGLGSLNSCSEEPTEVDLEQLQKVREILPLLPPGKLTL